MYKLKNYFFFPQITMKLYIPKVLVQHFGVYACKAKNPRGDTDGIITLSGNIFEFYSQPKLRVQSFTSLEVLHSSSCNNSLKL